MASSYERDPRVPPLRVERLGKRRRSDEAEAVAKPSAPADTATRIPDPGPSYEDFLENGRDDVSLPDKTG